MGKAIKKPTLDLIEPVVAPTIHADGVAHVTIVGTDVHLLLYADHVGLDGGTEHHVVGRLVMPMDPLQSNNMLIGQAVMQELADRRAKAM